MFTGQLLGFISTCKYSELACIIPMHICNGEMISRMHAHGRSRNEVKLDVVAANKHDQAEEYYETIGKMDFPRDLENKVYDYAHPPAADYEQPVPMLPKRTPGNNKFQYNPCSAYKAPGSKQDPKSVKY